MRRRWLAFLASLALAVMAAATWLWACGPFFEDLPTVVRVYPVDPERYVGGEIGVVRPTFARVSLLRAYRVLAGKPPLPEPQMTFDQVSEAEGVPPYHLAGQWSGASAAVLGVQPTFVASARVVPGADYQWFTNCLADSFASALRTLEDRRTRFGAGSDALRDWTAAQIAVFRNCGENEPVLPEPAPPAAPALLRADRAYQTAAAHFYALRFDEAGRRFAAVAGDASSPWRPYGRYLAGRNLIRQASLTTEEGPARDGLLSRAETELRATLADARAKALHGAARRLLDLVAARRHPVRHLHELTARLVSEPTATARDLRDYEWLMDRFVGGDTVDYDYETVASRAAIVEGDDASDWVLAFQGRGEPAVARAVERWQATRSLPWLVAVLWKAPPNHPVVPAALEAAAKVESTSAGYPTVAFLRVRLLALSGRRAEARALLATMPTTTGPQIDAETLNLFQAERFMLADTFEELVANAARTALDESDTPVFDDDAGELFSRHTPLARLVESAEAPVLPPRLRLRVASAALARAIVLGRAEEGGRAAAVLEELSPAAVRADLDRYATAASDEERQRAGLLLLLRTPGLRAYVLGMEDDAWLAVDEPARELDHVLQRNWWCSEDGRLGPAWSEWSSALPRMLYGEWPPSPGTALSPAELATADAEVARLVALGGARDHLAALALEWARARPADPEVAEALARVVEGGRWAGCKDERSSALSKQAFQTLHRLFPRSDWARQTKYWYE